MSDESHEVSWFTPDEVDRLPMVESIRRRSAVIGATSAVPDTGWRSTGRRCSDPKFAAELYLALRAIRLES